MLLASLPAQVLKDLAPAIDQWMASQDDEIDRLSRENKRLKQGSRQETDHGR